MTAEQMAEILWLKPKLNSRNGREVGISGMLIASGSDWTKTAQEVVRQGPGG